MAAAVAALAMSVRPVPAAPEPTSDAADRSRPLPWVQRLQVAAADLGLTEEQRARLRELFDANRDHLRAVWADPALTREEKQEKLRALRAKLEPELQQILTPEQREKWKERKARPLRPTSTPGASALQLSDEQRAKLRELLQPHLEKLRALRQNPDLTPQEKREQFLALREELTPRLGEVLTPEQLERWQTARPEILRQFWERQRARRDSNQ